MDIVVKAANHIYPYVRVSQRYFKLFMPKLSTI